MIGIFRYIDTAHISVYTDVVTDTAYGYQPKTNTGMVGYLLSQNCHVYVDIPQLDGVSHVKGDRQTSPKMRGTDDGSDGECQQIA